MIIYFDWDGVIARKEVSEKANLRRADTLKMEKSEEYLKEGMKDESHFEDNKKAIKEYTGIKEDSFLTAVMTDLFKYHYLGVVNELKEDSFYEDVLEVLQRLKEEGHKLIIITGLVEDIITYTLKSLGIESLFEGVYGNTSDLRLSKTEQAIEASKEHGKPDLFVGDKEKDLRAGKDLNCETAFSTWGHGTEGLETSADYVLESPQDLLKIVREIE